MITLYELHWSHFCEKIRLALNYMGLPWQMVGIDAFKKEQLRQHPLPSHLKKHTVPPFMTRNPVSSSWIPRPSCATSPHNIRMRHNSFLAIKPIATPSMRRSSNSIP